MTEPSTSTSTSETGEVTAVLDTLAGQDEKPAPVQEPKRPEPTIPYSWRTLEPPITFEYITDCDRANEVLETLEPCAFGFDAEWKPVYLKGQPENKVALIQLANDQVIYLLQVSAMQRFPERLQAILESATYTKAGVGIQEDAKKVYRDCGVSMRGCIDLSLLARSVDSRWKGKYSNPIGLANLVATYEFLALGKGKITRSNWEAQLSFNQQEYAANDGHSGYTIYSRLVKMAGEMVNPPGESCYSFGIHRGILCNPTGSAWHPVNPDYDPGPPPPPRPPKEKKKKEKTGEAENGPAISQQPKQAQQLRGHNQQQQHVEGLNSRLGEIAPGPSTGQASGRQRPIWDRTEAGGRHGRGYKGPGPVRQQHGRGRGRGGGNKIGTFDKAGPWIAGD